MKVRRPIAPPPSEGVSAPYSNALLGGGIQDDSRIYTDLLKAIQPGTPGQTPRIAVIASSKVTLTKAWQQHHGPDDRPSVAQEAPGGRRPRGGQQRGYSTHQREVQRK